jgi:endonuclease III
MAQARLDKAEGEWRRMKEILRILKREYPEATCSLLFDSPFQLLVATILSAQCTDERVNKVTPDLFQRFPDSEEMAKAKVSEIETLIRSTNFFRNKAKAISETSKILVTEYAGKVPMDLEKLTQLRGVGRKTANVVLGVAYGVPGLVVDTHVGRLSRRLGFTKDSDPVKVEHTMMEIVPKEDWTIYAHLMIDHGRKICTARKAHCEICIVSQLCPKVGV